MNVAWANEEDQAKGWTLDPAYLGSIKANAWHGYGENICLEEVEAVILSVLDVGDRPARRKSFIDRCDERLDVDYARAVARSKAP